MIQKCAPASTGMMAINLNAVAIGKILASSSEFSDITIACYNSPDDHVVSGPVARLQALKSYLDGAVRCKSFLLPVGFGYHSNAMSPLQEDLTSLAGRITISPPVIPITSNVYGKLVLPGDASVFDAQYYSRHCTEPVLFDQGIRGSVAHDSVPVINAWIEIGPHAMILPTLKRHPAFPKDALFLASMWKRQHPFASLHSALARLYVSPLASEMKWRNVFSYLPFVSNTSLQPILGRMRDFGSASKRRHREHTRLTLFPGQRLGTLDFLMPSSTHVYSLHLWETVIPSCSRPQ